MTRFWKFCTATTLCLATFGWTIPSFAQEAPTAPTCTDQSAKCLYEQDKYRLDRLTQNCKEQKKSDKNMTYRVCRKSDKIVSASESLTKEGDGMGYWFENGKVIAMVYFHDGTLVTFNKGKVSAVYQDGGTERSTTPTATARKQFENAAVNGYQSIFKKMGIR
jgi:hypothetical protein